MLVCAREKEGERGSFSLFAGVVSNNHYRFLEMSKTGAVVYWAGGKYSDYDRQLLAIVVIFTTTIMFSMEVLARKGAITRFLTKIHRWHGITYILCTLTAVLHEVLMKSPEGAGCLCFVMFVFHELSFIALYATEEISYEVSRTLAMFQCGYLLIHMIEGDHSSAIACSISLLACWIVKVLRLAELRSSPSSR
ncbi:hypothetical protein POM88_025132 [Heracleum sosnowskyi]|uniref:Uncharacterized protein n=1 Tax=Heracleum sosnowskyi TaxID=360622 RepID=A0AAD8I5U2_9APIA|nr:hypothetical protein POM88_025132 [Heracleum sosnowskyi]